MLQRTRQSGYINIRSAFMLPALLLLLVPITNYIIIQWAASYLERQNRADNQQLLYTVETILLNDLSLLGSRDAYIGDKAPIFLADALREVDIDGRLNDWGHVEELEADELKVLQEAVGSKANFNLRVRAQELYDHIYLFFDVTDDSVVYREISNISIHRNDHIRLSAIDSSGNFQRYTIATEQPGTVYGRVVSTGGRSLRRETRIEGSWRATDLGYQVEVKIHKDVVSDAIAFSVSDVDDPVTRNIISVVGSGATDQTSDLRPFTRRSSRLDSLLSSLGSFQFADTYGNIIAGKSFPEDAEFLNKPCRCTDNNLAL